MSARRCGRLAEDGRQRPRVGEVGPLQVLGVSNAVRRTLFRGRITERRFPLVMTDLALEHASKLRHFEAAAEPMIGDLDPINAFRAKGRSARVRRLARFTASTKSMTSLTP